MKQYPVSIEHQCITIFIMQLVKYLNFDIYLIFQVSAIHNVAITLLIGSRNVRDCVIGQQLQDRLPFG